MDQWAGGLGFCQPFAATLTNWKYKP